MITKISKIEEKTSIKEDNTEQIKVSVESLIENYSSVKERVSTLLNKFLAL